MKIVVTGGTGFLGKHVCAALEKEGLVAVPVGSADYDLRNNGQIVDLLRDEEPQAIVHLAARVGGIGENVDQPGTFLYENAMMGLQLMDAARAWGVEKMLTVGTACMYPDTATIPMREDAIWNGPPSRETGAYAQAKRLILAQGVAYAEQYDFNAVFVVPSNLYGPGDESSHVVPMLTRKFYDALETGDDVELWGSGSATRDFLYVEDAAAGVVQALLYYNDPQPVNLGTGVETPIYALARAVAWEIGYEGEIRWDPTRPEGTLRRALDCTRARQKFGWTPKFRLRQGLPRYLAWFEGVED